MDARLFYISTPMILTLKFLCSKSGKAVALQVDEKTYLFNMFEGFQRYAIEMQFSLVSIDALFLTSKACIPGLMGTYLTLSESQKRHINIISSFDPKFFETYKFYMSPILQLSFSSEYKDKYISVEMFDIKDTTNFIVSLPKVNGTIRANEIPKEIPRRLYKDFMSKGEITIDDKTYHLSSYKDNDVKLNKIAFIFSEIDAEAAQSLEKSIDGIPCVFCFNDSSWSHLSKTRSSVSDLGMNFNGLFSVKDNDFIEFADFYDQQFRLNSMDERILLPYSGESHEISSLNSTVFTGDKLSFTKKTGIQLIRKDNRITTPVCYKAQYPCIEFLGTGCAIPSKYRNVSAILYQNEDSAILMDAGEDTITQLYRLHGSLDAFRKLKVIYISHNHADHMLGVAAVVKSLINPVLIIAPRDVKEYLAYFGVISTEISPNDQVVLRNPVSIITTDFIKAKEHSFYRRPREGDLDVTDYIQRICIEDFEIIICGCRHSKSSISVAITDKHNGKKISYSGDTEPSELFSIIARESDVMIHEATFEESLVAEARRRLHSTDTEALLVFEKSESKKLLLTHISNRSDISDEDSRYVRDFFRFDFK